MLRSTSFRPFSTGGNYVNFQTADEEDARIGETYGANLRRLAEIKQRYDPENCGQAGNDCRDDQVCTAGVCPADKRVGNDVVCRPSRGACDVEERCDGQGLACPGDRKVAAGTVCQAVILTWPVVPRSVRSGTV